MNLLFKKPVCIGKFTAISLFALYLQGCANSPTYDSSLTMAGPKQTVSNKYEDIDLIALLDPDKRSGIGHKDDPSQYSGKDYDTVISQFEANNPSTIGDLKYRRNLIQNRILAASNLRCGRFTLHLRNQTSDTNFGFGFATTLFTAAAASVSNLSQAKTLSALGAVSSGTRSEYNTEYLGNLTVSVVVKAIEQSRNEMRADIQRQQIRSYASYDISSALADAVRYDASCSAISGMEAANEAVQRMQEPGRQAVARALLSDQVNRALSTGNIDDINKLKTISDGLASINSPWINQALKQTQAQAIFNTPSDSDGDVPDPLSALSRLREQSNFWLQAEKGQIAVLLTAWKDTSATGKGDGKTPSSGQYAEMETWLKNFNSDKEQHSISLKAIESIVADNSSSCRKSAWAQQAEFAVLSDDLKTLLADPSKAIDVQTKKGNLLKKKQDMNALLTGALAVEKFFTDERLEWADVTAKVPDFDSMKKKWSASVARQKGLQNAVASLTTQCSSSN